MNSWQCMELSTNTVTSNQCCSRPPAFILVAGYPWSGSISSLHPMKLPEANRIRVPSYIRLASAQGPSVPKMQQIRVGPTTFPLIDPKFEIQFPFNVGGPKLENPLQHGMTSHLNRPPGPPPRALMALLLACVASAPPPISLLAAVPPMTNGETCWWQINLASSQPESSLSISWSWDAGEGEGTVHTSELGEATSPQLENVDLDRTDRYLTTANGVLGGVRNGQDGTMCGKDAGHVDHWDLVAGPHDGEEHLHRWTNHPLTERGKEKAVWRRNLYIIDALSSRIITVHLGWHSLIL